MPEKSEATQAIPADLLKELTRKLHWAVTSTCNLDRDRKIATFAWAARVAQSILLRAVASSPSASRNPSKKRDPLVASSAQNGYHGQAEGGVVGFQSNGHVPPKRSRPAAQPFGARKAFLLAQQAMKAKALAYVKAEKARGKI